MYYTVLDKDLNKVLTGSYTEVRKFLESKTYAEIYYVFDQAQEELYKAIEFFAQGSN